MPPARYVCPLPYHRRDWPGFHSGLTAAKHRMLRTTSQFMAHNIKLMALAHMTVTPVWTKTQLTGPSMRINRNIGSKSSIRAIFTGLIMQFLAEAWRPELNCGKVIGAPLRVTI